MNYVSYFHDGSIFEIKHTDDTLDILMESAELLPSQNVENFPLSPWNTLKGILHFEEVELIIENGVHLEKLELLYDEGDIFRFKIEGNKVFFM